MLSPHRTDECRMNIKSPFHSAAFLKPKQEIVGKEMVEHPCLQFATSECVIPVKNLHGMYSFLKFFPTFCSAPHVWFGEFFLIQYVYKDYPISSTQLT